MFLCTFRVVTICQQSGMAKTEKIYFYKRTLDSYVCPNQSKGNRTNQSTFLRGKNILKWCNYTGKSKMYSYSFSFSAQKALFLHPLETHIDNAYWPEVHPILWSKCPAFRWGTFCQIWMVGLGVTFGQPKGVKLGILC